MFLSLLSTNSSTSSSGVRHLPDYTLHTFFCIFYILHFVKTPVRAAALTLFLNKFWVFT